ncbi:hypothetical protein QVD17_20371 [Tagetes erecta]|uniref:TF-B3 domain-containing protein n=1 Tax=Tagetes erecta TaxID=13708 RepID=A0AAD8NX75_TARER|nr:hypothetical protein QVD17_20371 [Tagetes erecta]
MHAFNPLITLVLSFTFLKSNICKEPLPPTFVSKYLKNKIPNGPIVIYADGGYLWRLKIKQIDDDCCFTSGWKKVVEDISLDFADFLFFQLLDECSFKMTVYNPDGCENILPQNLELDDDVSNGDIREDVADEEDEKDDDNDDDNDDDPFFTTTISKGLMRFPPGFVGLAGIKGEGTMTMKNPDGKEWHVSLLLESTCKRNRYYLSAGWSLFIRENSLQKGDICVFKFIKSEGKLLVSKVTMKNSPTKRQRGRPPKQKSSVKV